LYDQGTRIQLNAQQDPTMTAMPMTKYEDDQQSDGEETTIDIDDDGGNKADNRSRLCSTIMKNSGNDE